MSKLPYRSLRTLAKTYGPLMMVKLGSIPYVIVSSADAIQELTDKDHDVIFSGRPQWKSSDALFGGSTDIIFSSYGEYWRQMKKICMVEVLSQRRVNQFRYIREQEVEHLVGMLKDASKNKTAVDLSEAISTLTNTVISRAAFGKTYNNQQMSDGLRVQKERELEFNFTDANIKATLLDMFAGGTDTIATTLEWVMSELVRHPTIMKKAQEEVRRIVLMGSERKSGIDEADISRMEYLKCVVKETVSLRKTSEDVKLGGFDIPEGTMVMINLWAVMRDPEIWEQPESFVPERFLAEPLDFKGQTGKFVPFGAGRRLCPGMTLALVEVELVAANLLCWFDWELPEGVVDLDMSEINSVVIRRETPLSLVPVLNSE
ncbi:unnamed protein product [Linum tenue]|uniref:Cytochrome P450 n=1 Tax=Linum tenue TaxID=586396 RepID=A0AAV0JM35_9ROSI|nr:unnamed protein product [Linum tenue]